MREIKSLPQDKTTGHPSDSNIITSLINVPSYKVKIADGLEHTTSLETAVIQTLRKQP